VSEHANQRGIRAVVDKPATRIPGTVTIPEAASLLGVSKSAAYRAVEARLAGDIEAWPTNIIRIGRTLRIPGIELRALLGFDPAA
jgi:predicted DNA-binding transcriptional regulator AlpA